MSGLDQTPIERAEATISYGLITCDVCREIPAERRDSGGECWPDQPVAYLNADANMAFEFWALEVCPHHDPEEPPEEATHRVVFDTHHVEDHRMNSSIGREAVDVEVLE